MHPQLLSSHSQLVVDVSLKFPEFIIHNVCCSESFVSNHDFHFCRNSKRESAGRLALFQSAPMSYPITESLSHSEMVNLGKTFPSRNYQTFIVGVPSFGGRRHLNTSTGSDLGLNAITSSRSWWGGSGTPSIYLEWFLSPKAGILNWKFDKMLWVMQYFVTGMRYGDAFDSII